MDIDDAVLQEAIVEGQSDCNGDVLKELMSEQGGNGFNPGGLLQQNLGVNIGLPNSGEPGQNPPNTGKAGKGGKGKGGRNGKGAGGKGGKSGKGGKGGTDTEGITKVEIASNQSKLEALQGSITAELTACRRLALVLQCRKFGADMAHTLEEHGLWLASKYKDIHDRKSTADDIQTAAILAEVDTYLKNMEEAMGVAKAMEKGTTPKKPKKKKSTIEDELGSGADAGECSVVSA